ncbi:MAG: histidine phosphatase family protein [Firmicutes bacterium]|nr:histidine phosphatase family protein [Bacillota bacterium]
MRLIMIRHPRTEANEKKLVYGRTDALYSESGKATIPWIVEKLHDVKIDRIYASPLTRTRLLAEEIAADHGIAADEIFMDDRILEMNFGKFENKTTAQLEAEYPEEFQAYRENFNDAVVPEGESYRQVAERAEAFLKDIYHRHERESEKEETIVVVAHSLVIHAAMAWLMEVDLDHAWHFKTEPGTLVDFDWRYEYAMLQSMTGPFNVRGVK